jgi:hypothetical protein
MGKITTIFMENQGKLMFLCRLHRKCDALIFWERIVSISCHVAGTLFLLLAILGAWILSFVWIKKEFKNNLKQIEKRQSSN